MSKSILITGCSWIQKMHKYNDTDFIYKSYGGQGLWKIYNSLKDLKDSSSYQGIVVQLPAPVRNHPTNISTTDRFNLFLNRIEKLGEQKAREESINEYKQKILDINKLHKNIVFFLYNVGGYPLRHPYDFGKEADKELINFFEENNLQYLYLSFEEESGYGITEENGVLRDFWEYYHTENPYNQKNKNFKKYWSIISPKGTIILDPHPNKKADIKALELIKNYFKI
tara:strand:+ start:17056 stop:17733 length:678 start_codon:yes stop_codon:yes gene_type:complete